MYLSGVRSADPDIGLLVTPRSGYSVVGEADWAMDNGAFTGAYPGDEAFIALLSSPKYANHRERCLFVCAPDVLCDAEATLEKALAKDEHGFNIVQRIRGAGYKSVALVGQDGMEALNVPWHLFDWLFLGGSTEWKLGEGAANLASQAHWHGLRVHMGRVNSLKRLRYAASIGCASADGTVLKFDKSRPVGDWVRKIREESAT